MVAYCVYVLPLAKPPLQANPFSLLELTQVRVLHSLKTPGRLRMFFPFLQIELSIEVLAGAAQRDMGSLGFQVKGNNSVVENPLGLKLIGLDIEDVSFATDQTECHLEVGNTGYKSYNSSAKRHLLVSLGLFLRIYCLVSNQPAFPVLPSKRRDSVWTNLMH
ncbi:hypothetical protein Fot_14642 [Forsythia ovata]|uniref:Uncharacterized protein n=1 Tax=Forsythia ovata TaxID=205694 RepID=A0ABD1W6X1_9LAMI